MSVELMRYVGMVGFFLIVGLVMLVGWAKKAQIPNWEFAAKRFRQDFPQLEAVDGFVTQDQEVALLQLRQDNQPFLGAVMVTGDKWVTRLISPEEYRVEPSDTGLSITTSDLTTRKLKPRMNAQDIQRWMGFWNGLEGDAKWKS